MLRCFLPVAILTAILLGLMVGFLWPRCMLVEPKPETFQISSLRFSQSITKPSISITVWSMVCARNKHHSFRSTKLITNYDVTARLILATAF